MTQGAGLFYNVYLWWERLLSNNKFPVQCDQYNLHGYKTAWLAQAMFFISAIQYLTGS